MQGVCLAWVNNQLGEPRCFADSFLKPKRAPSYSFLKASGAAAAKGTIHALEGASWRNAFLLLRCAAADRGSNREVAVKLNLDHCVCPAFSPEEPAQIAASNL